ncbi:MAG: RecX family transcriptional regulator [Coriobacteriales bacterium]|nr:RecX family transcriptional regulator [Coriobacteriales bacterium]
MSKALRTNGTFGSSGSSGNYEDSGAGGSKGAAKRRDSSDASDPEKKAEKPKGYKECYTKMLNLLAMRDFTELSMRERLLKAEFQPTDVEKAVARAVELRYIDDNRFAQAFVRQKSESGWGRGKIARELEKLGIPSDECADILGELLSEDDELEHALRLLQKHRTSAKNARDAHYRYLLGKGFSPAICAKALRKLDL